MSFSVFEKLDVGEVKPTNVTFQLADKSIKYPRGIMEDVLVKVENLYFPVDFVILEMEEDMVKRSIEAEDCMRVEVMNPLIEEFVRKDESKKPL